MHSTLVLVHKNRCSPPASSIVLHFLSRETNESMDLAGTNKTEGSGAKKKSADSDKDQPVLVL